MRRPISSETKPRGRWPLTALALLCLACPDEPRETVSIQETKQIAMSDETEGIEKVVKTEGEWKEILTPEQYHIAREKGTEPAFTGEYNDCKDEGTYTCVACGAGLFSSDAKFDSGSGWPSYWKPVDGGPVATAQDASQGMVRTEALCGRCDSHLGHVFEDGPPPTGLRYCINSASLKLVKKEE